MKVANVFFESQHHNFSIFEFFSNIEVCDGISFFYIYFDRKGYFPEKNYVQHDKSMYFSANSEFLPWLNNSHVQFDVIIFHGMFNSTVWSFFSEHVDICKKSIWTVFGGELYEGLENIKPEKLLMLKNVVNNFKLVLTFTLDEQLILQSKLEYGGDVKRYVYIQDWDMPNAEPIGDFLGQQFNFGCDEKVVIVGNSGTPANLHIQVLERLYAQNFSGKILIPLAYGGDPDYLASIKSYLANWFEPNHYFILDGTIPNKLYRQLLSRIDCYILPHVRQQAGQHWMSAFASGKAVYGNPEGANYKKFETLGFNVGNIFEASFKDIDDDKLLFNCQLYRKIFSFESAKSIWVDAIRHTS
ncbi:TDP-N-acetylfucosamine:lipid II N-acetylfucosaminyltransferase [Rheinheimera riviphila]|uniref:TDP-N-acetylfucosamine:lipid II N-acetylfucosaminyltransferase n=1 Tax=Rheinheimera riviphila TaxID=1834037 RepID=UPI0013E3B428|nr:TDP-N-acetylfucosamine:lipid II N-acetylfucosaminyltransferase [Rheinheimera riviphila]